jgi:hypothetical protein
VDITEFVKARLDEDEAAAKLAAREGGTWKQDDPDRHPGAISSLGGPVVYDEGSPDENQAAHIVRHDPARGLREVAAKRARLALMIEATAEMDRLLADEHAGRVDQAMAIGRARSATVAVKHDATVWSDHPDYRAEWKP